MDRDITVIKKHKGKVSSVLGNAILLTDLGVDLDFLTNPSNDGLMEYLDSHPPITNDILISSYGIIIIDYDSKVIHNRNHYSNYIGASSLNFYKNDRLNSKFPIDELFERSMLAIFNTKQGGDVTEHTLTNLNDMDTDLSTMSKLLNWIQANEYISKGNGCYEVNNLFIDVTKMGWKYIHYLDNDVDYIRLYSNLIKSGFIITDDMLEQWRDYTNIGEHFYTTAKSIYRDNIFKELSI